MSKQQEILELVNNWLKFAEAKNAVIMAIAGTAIFNLIKLLITTELHIIADIYIVQLVICLTFSFLIALSSFVPITNYLFILPKDKTSESDNLLFFGHLAKYTKDDLIAKFNETEDTETNTKYRGMYIEQIIINSRIAMSKYYFFNLAVTLFFWGILSPIIGPIVINSIKKNQRSITKSV